MTSPQIDVAQVNTSMSTLTDLGTEDEEDDNMDQEPLFNSQVLELQEAVVEMKGAFVQALHQLSALESEERAAREEQQKARTDTERQLAEALKLLITFKTELGSTQQIVKSLQERTRSLELTVRALAEERDALTHELLLCGSLPPAARLRIQPPTAPGSSGAPSSDSGVALLLERAHAAFSVPPQAPATNDPSVINTLVQDYVATLGGGISGDDEDEDLTTNEERAVQDDQAGYDSECSLSLAAAKSLSLSTSLGQQCGLELEGGSCDEEVPTTNTESDAQKDWRDARRLEVARELLVAEQTYCQTLQTMHDSFAEPLRASGILSATDLNTLFPEEVWQLRTEHGALLAGLRARLSSWNSSTRLGDLLQRLLADVLRLYNSYANAFPEVLQTFHRLCRASPAFTRFLKSCLQRPACAGLDLGTLLLTPVQHMPHYVLILRHLLHVTSPGSEDYTAIAACLARLKDFLARLNDSMEHSFQLVSAQIGAPRPQPCNSRGTKGNRRSSSHHRNIPSRADVSRREARRDADISRRRTQQRTQSARPSHNRRSASEWALQSQLSSSRHHHSRHHMHSSDDESDMMLSSSEGLGSPTVSCAEGSPAGFSAISEPSLADTGVSSPSGKKIVPTARPLSGAHSVHNVSKNVTYVARTFWSSESRCDDLAGNKDEKQPKKKKRSLRASLKNILTFRKRCVVNAGVPSIESSAVANTGQSPEVEKSLKGLVQQLGRMPGYIELVVYCLRETAV